MNDCIDPYCNLCGQISGRWDFGKVIEIGFEVEMSQLFPDFEKFGKLTKNGRESQGRPKTRPRGANPRACNLGCAKYTVNLVHGNGASGRGEIFFFYASGGGCTSSPRTAMPTSGCLCQKGPFQYIELSHPGNLKCPSFWNWYFSDCSNCNTDPDSNRRFRKFPGI